MTGSLLLPLIGGNMSGRNSRELAKEFRVSRQLNPDAERVVYHVSLSAAKDDVISEDKWCEIGNRYMKEMGFDANQFVIFRHENTDDDHVHIAASRIRMDTGKVVHDSWDYVRSEKVLRQIEIDYDLVQVQGSRERLNRTQSTGQFRRIKREQEEYEQGKRDTPPEPSIKELVQQTIDNASVDNPQMPTLIMRLQQTGISVRTGFTRNGKSKGISYEKDGIAFSGTQLGAAYTFPGLQKHLRIDYQPQRDDARIEQLLNNPVGRTVENQQPINAIAENEAQPLTTDKPKLNQNQAIELYQYYSGDLQSLLVIDRDKEIALRALLDNHPAPDVEEIVKASPAGWTNDEAKTLVLIATNQLALDREQKQREPQFTPPPEDESLRPVLQHFLTQKRGISNFLVHPLQEQGLGYIDQQRNVVFIKRDLNGKKSGALVWDTTRPDNRCSQYPENTQSNQGWFQVNLGGKSDDKIERVFLCDSPIDALTMAEIDRKAHKGMPPVRTMYMVVDDPHNLPLSVLKNVSRIGLAFNKDKQGQETASAVLELLPQSKILPPDNHTWNQDLLERLHHEQEKRFQQQRGFSR
ncbi:relaxase/mobilization nuclease domain-containing protein [Nostoc sp. UHCC 0870]|uniref:relaxase/mobilization nuclease domain-containing protein n=1 Tax=Nostoc sp. UHCC 0870 TaxID=2914041 RepID=UPI001EDD1F13|nr:relaxase/mobilization nuclease domain-containing protein [Nostoc sp. UHCC 0870]UKP01585.1 relaxase/mobilization nuclease domain-containing protein [Nostoc sp. UHCC 0870]